MQSEGWHPSAPDSTCLMERCTCTKTCAVFTRARPRLRVFRVRVDQVWIRTRRFPTTTVLSIPRAPAFPPSPSNGTQTRDFGGGGVCPSINAAYAYTSVKHISWTVRRSFQMSSASNLFKNRLIHVSFECKIQPLLIKLDPVHHKQPHTSNCMGIHLYLPFPPPLKCIKGPSCLPQTQKSNSNASGCNSPC